MEHDHSSEKPERQIKKIRPLKVKDLHRLIKILENSITEIGEEYMDSVISSNVPQTNTGSSSVEEETGITVVTIGINALKKLVSVYDEEISTFFADLLEVDLEEYLEMDIDMPVQVIKQIQESEPAQVFFTMSSQVSKKIGWLEKPLKALKKKYGSFFEEAKEGSENSPTVTTPSS